MHKCVLTVTYLKGGFSACSVVCLLVSFFFLMFLKFRCNCAKMSFKSFKNHGSYLHFLELFQLTRLFLWGAAQLHLFGTASST